MRMIRPSSEAEMIAAFLRQEHARPERFGATLGAAMARIGVDSTLLTAPDLTDMEANDARRRLLGAYRGYGTGERSYLTDFPDRGVTWNWVAMGPEELLDSRLIRYVSWHELSAGTRSPQVAAERIRRGAVDATAAAPIRELADRLRAGLTVAPVILVSADDGATRVILEGHTRITAWALAPETIAVETEVLLGVSPGIAAWDEY